MAAPHAPLEALAGAPLSRQHRRIVDALASAYPRSMSVEGLVDAVYGDDPDGGPVSADVALRVRIVLIRKELRPYGWTIPSNRGGAGHYGRYKLEPVKL